MSRAALPLLEVDLGQRVRAAFTLAVGADGRGANLSLVVGADDHDGVVARRAALASWVGAPLVYGRQVHGADVHVVTAPPHRDEPVGPVDALVTTTTGVGLAVLVADCVPVLLADPTVGVVAAVHAGRQGLVAGVVPAAVAAMERLGARTGTLRAVVGPAVCGACYEVPPALRDEVEAAVPGTAAVTSWGTPSLDLPVGVLHQLRDAGVGRADRVGGCTLSDTSWFSHRGAAAVGTARAAGRFAGVVRLLPAPG